MKPWLRWWRVRSQRFEALPVGTRGLLAELLAHTTADGRIDLGTSDLTALWRFIGAHPRERRALAKHLQQLIKNGSVVPTDDGWEFPSFMTHQADRKGSRSRRQSAPDVRSADTGRALGVHSACVGRASGVHPTDAKPPDSFNTGPGEGEREGEEEKEERVDVVQGRSSEGASVAVDDGGGGAKMRARERNLANAEKALRLAVAGAVERVTGAPATGTQLQLARTLREWLVGWMRSEMCPEGATLTEAASGTVDAFIDAKRRGRTLPLLKWLAEDPTRWAEAWANGQVERQTAAAIDAHRAQVEQPDQEPEVEPVTPEEAQELVRGLYAIAGGGASPDRPEAQERGERQRESEEDRRRELDRQRQELISKMEAAQ